MIISFLSALKLQAVEEKPAEVPGVVGTASDPDGHSGEGERH